jgi:hypothetical protein
MNSNPQGLSTRIAGAYGMSTRRSGSIALMPNRRRRLARIDRKPQFRSLLAKDFYRPPAFEQGKLISKVAQYARRPDQAD